MVCDGCIDRGKLSFYLLSLSSPILPWTLSWPAHAWALYQGFLRTWRWQQILWDVWTGGLLQTGSTVVLPEGENRPSAIGVSPLFYFHGIRTPVLGEDRMFSFFSSLPCCPFSAFPELMVKLPCVWSSRKGEGTQHFSISFRTGWDSHAVCFLLRAKQNKKIRKSASSLR